MTITAYLFFVCYFVEGKKVVPSSVFSNDHGKIRTHNLELRRLTRYPIAPHGQKVTFMTRMEKCFYVNTIHENDVQNIFQSNFEK